jgi:hypothetical protein
MMENIFIEATPDTPAVKFEITGRLILEGRSLTENVALFYNPLIEWVRELNVESVTVDINLDYMNSGSSNQLLSILKVLDTNSKIGKLIVNWHYDADDEDTLETGQIYEELLSNASFRYYEFSESTSLLEPAT